MWIFISTATRFCALYPHYQQSSEHRHGLRIDGIFQKISLLNLAKLCYNFTEFETGESRFHQNLKVGR